MTPPTPGGRFTSTYHRSQQTTVRSAPGPLLLADALAGRVSVVDVHSFIRNLDAFVDLLVEVPDVDLAAMDDDQLARVVDLCTFGFPGVWAPKVTKVAALYRPRAVPVLDGYMALAFGYARERFSNGREPRHQAIDAVVRALAMRTRRRLRSWPSCGGTPKRWSPRYGGCRIYS